MARFSGRTRSVLFLASSPLLGLAGWQFWSRRSFFEPFTAQTDPLFQSHYLKKFNPRSNPSEDDCCVRLVPLAKLRADLVEDSLNGGPKLVESFTAGLWGGFGFAIQRAIMKRTCKNDTNRNDMWDKEELLKSVYEPGTIVADHFIVLEKTSRAIVMRGGLSPRESPNEPREMDNICEVTVDVNTEGNTAVFRYKNIYFHGLGHQTSKPFSPPLVWLHRQYCKLLIEAAVQHCME